MNIPGTEKGKVVLIQHRKGGEENPLKVSMQKGNKKKADRVLIRCGCCPQALEISLFGIDIENLIHEGSLEINGVMGTIDQWKQVLLPLLGMKEKK